PCRAWRLSRRAAAARGSSGGLGAVALAQLGGGQLHGLEDLGIAGAAAQVPRKRLGDLPAARVAPPLEQRPRAHQDSGSGEAALRPTGAIDRVLERMRPARRGDALDGHDLLALVVRERQRDARQDRLAVHHDRAGAAVTLVTSLFRSDETQAVAESLEQSRV